MRMPVVSDYTALLYATNWNGENATNNGRSAILTYSFSTSPQPYLSPSYSQDFINSFQPMNEFQKSQGRLAFNQWGAASGLIFVEVPAGTGSLQIGNFDFQYSSSPTAAGFASTPSVTIYKNYGGFQGNSFISTYSSAGDIFFDRTYANAAYAQSDLLHVFLHEIGHALGLKHPFEGTTTLNPALDNGAQTVMSYTSPRSLTLGPLDTQAIQYLYGTNAVDGTNLTGWNWNAATSVLTQVGLATDDQIIGGYQADVINGLGGNDVLAGMEGNDALIDLSGNNLMFGGDGNDTLTAGSGNDDIFGDNGYNEAAGLFFDTLDYSAAVSAITVNLAFSFFAGGRSYEAFGADIGQDHLGAIDAIRSGGGNDLFTAGSAALTVYAGLGRDTLNGGSGNDVFEGGGGNDTFDGGAGIDTAAFSANRLNYGLAKSGGGYVITDLRGGSPDGVDTLTGVERIRFGAATMSAEAFTPVSFNGDLRSDLLWCNTGGLAVTFLMNGTAVTGASAIGSANGASWRVRTAADLNGDGRSDLVWQDIGGQVVGYLMNGTALASAAVIGNATAAFRVVGSGDLNGDGNTDIILQNGSGQAVGWLMNGTGIIGAGTIGGANGASWSVAAVGDLNGDGLSDLVWQDTDGRTTGWLMNGLSVTSGALLAGANGASFSVRGVGDLNGDSTADIVWQYTNGQAGAWLMNGLTIAGAGAIGGANGSNVQIRDVADLNGDGKMDLIWQNTTNGQAIGFLMNGTTITSAGLIGAANGADWLIV
jgi:Ca2+-binding RTX toxin-like protein